MEAPGIRPTVPARPPQRVESKKQGGGGFEQAFREQNGEQAETAASDDHKPAPSGLQLDKPVYRRNQHRDDRQIDVVV